MNQAKTLADLLGIAARAVQVTEAEIARKAARVKLNFAYNRWKSENDVAYVKRDTPEWEAMTEATAKEYVDFDRAQRRERSARSRLSAAVIRSGQVQPLDLGDVEQEAA